MGKGFRSNRMCLLEARTIKKVMEANGKYSRVIISQSGSEFFSGSGLPHKRRMFRVKCYE
jgi:hypothetical protein